MRNYGDASAIAARATAPGTAALAIIRTSGEHSIELLAKIFSRPRALAAAEGNTVVYGWLLDENGGRIDEVLVSVCRAPKSFTGEDCADISCHGGEAVARKALESLRRAGFADALPGEFSFRAFMNGKLDLTRAESVAELVSARTGEAADRALKRLSGSLEKEFAEIRALLVEALASVEITLDYPDDEIDHGQTRTDTDNNDENSHRCTQINTDNNEPLCAANRRFDVCFVREILSRLESLAASYKREKLYREGALAVLAGRPNAGKSSLFNALLREERSIVAEIPGTTRDWVESSLSIEGIPVRLIDTAGLRAIKPADENDFRAQPDTIEEMGMKASREMAAQADIIIYVIDGTAGITPEDDSFLQENAGKTVISVWNKCDIVRELTQTNADFMRASAKTGEGLDALCKKIAKILLQNDEIGENSRAGSAALGTERQKNCVERAISALKAALSESENEFIAQNLREALDAIGEISGEASTGEVLEAMFGKFCVGK